MNNISIKTGIHIMLFVFASWIFSGCNPPKTETLNIAISKQSEAYTLWLLRNNSQINTINLYGMHIDSAIEVLVNCQGLLLTGGEDVYPAYYQKVEDTARCGTFDPYRDSLEFALIDYAVQHKMPIMGVCRGEQILNVALGGSLIIDIPQDFDTTVIHRQKDWQHCFHPVNAVAESMLVNLAGVTMDTVTSNHHQAIDQLAKALTISATSSDNLPEAIEWKNPQDKGFLLAVQWHPERMKTGSPYSDPLAKRFLKEATLFAHQEQK